MLILAPTAGTPPATESAEYIIRIAHLLSADLLALHIYEGDEPGADGAQALEVFAAAGRRPGVKVESLARRGPIVQAILAVTKERSADLIVMGASKGRVVDEWLSADVKQQATVPVVVIPHGVSALSLSP
jgi:nucleotide-binding universal stress UspA family protein